MQTRSKEKALKVTFPSIFFAETWWESQFTFYCFVPKRASKNIEGYTLLFLIFNFVSFFNAYRAAGFQIFLTSKKFIKMKVPLDKFYAFLRTKQL